MTRICFVSYEIHPTVMGGCGVLLHHSARVLLEEGHEVIFLFHFSRTHFERFVNQDRLALPHPENCRAYLVEDLLQDEPSGDFRAFASVYDYQAYRFYRAAARLCALERPDLIEFFEYCGVAYHALSAKAAGLDFADTHLAVRLHNTMELIDREQPNNLHGMDRYVMYGLERKSMRLAETVLYPSQVFLDETYRSYYGPWFGNLAHSQPALLDHPCASGQPGAPNGILFYGRLFGFKGVDRFVDAAVLYLSDPANPRRTFYLAGYDSHLPPTMLGSYQEYLLRKIPPELRPAFVFTGQLSWQRLGELLPEILFAVTPSYLESFCYAANELYEAGVPLIVANLPGLRDAFRDGENAVVFDGSVRDLAEKMQLLSCDEALRRRITRPYPVAGRGLGGFYERGDHPSWIDLAAPARLPELLICILVDDPAGLPATLATLPAAGAARLALLHPAAHGRDAPQDASAVLWLLGRLYLPRDLEGRAINPTNIRTAETLLVLQAGDLLDADFLPRSLNTLARLPQISYVGSWKRVLRGAAARLDPLPQDAVIEAVPFLCDTPFSRCVMRTPPGRLLIDLFDARAGRLGELAYLWQLETSETTGLWMPQALVTRQDAPEEMLDQPILDYLILRDDDPARKTALARFALTLRNRKKTLRGFRYEAKFGSPFSALVGQVIHWLATSRLSKAADRFPAVKDGARRLVRWVLSLGGRGR